MSTILVDVDGVVADIHQAWIDMYNADYGDSLRGETVKSWALHEYVKPECGVKIYDYLVKPDFYDNVPRILGASWAIEKLRANKHRVIFVSAGLYTSKVYWLHKNGFLKEFPYKDNRPETATDIVLANDKSLIQGDYLIDDRADNVVHYPHGWGLLFTQPWNESFRVDNLKLFRVDDWYGVLSFFGIGNN